VTNIATLSASDLRTDAQVKLLCAKAGQMLVKMKQVCEDQHLQFVGPTEFVPTEGRIYEFGWEEDVGPRIELNSADSSFQFWQKTNQIAFFYNKKLEPLLDGKDAPHFDKPDVPKQSIQQTIQIAAAFLSILDVPSDIKLGNPHAQFHPQMDLPKYLLGEWSIRWLRLDGKEHPFSCDVGVSITISEGYGPSALGAGLNVPYQEQQGVPISVAAAIDIAKKSRPAFGTPSNDITDYTLKNSELMIVKPDTGQPCRLAWVIWLQPIRTQPTQYDDSQEVSVDAFTGQIIGVDAML
jgi:hypothetical protein